MKSKYYSRGSKAPEGTEAEAEVKAPEVKTEKPTPKKEKGENSGMGCLVMLILLIILGFLAWNFFSSNLKGDKADRPKTEFTLDKDQESQYIRIPQNSTFRVFGCQGEYDMIFSNGEVVTVRPNEDISIPRMDEAVFKIRSRQDSQKFEIYWERRKR
jgi:hypothetical protein